MIITCPCDGKQFELDANLIPANGRLLQCGFCGHTWHFKIDVKEPDTIDIKHNEDNTKKTIESDMYQGNTADDKIDDLKIKKNLYEDRYSLDDGRKNINLLYFFKNTLVIIITLIALLIAIDTFKLQISKVFPGINQLLNSLYESLTDIKLFLKDLLK